MPQQPRVVLICGRYEGVDERVAEHLATDELSIGDYVLSGGEMAAAVVMESVARLLPGVLGNEESAAQDSFGEESAPGRKSVAARLAALHAAGGFPGDAACPEVLLSGDHAEILPLAKAPGA